VSRAGRLLLAAAAALPVAGAIAWSLDLFWRAIGGGPMSVHGWIALTLGVLGTVLLAWGLMALAFRSHREGWDDRVDNSLDPGRDDEP
jgi:cation transporter-like permease